MVWRARWLVAGRCWRNRGRGVGPETLTAVDMALARGQCGGVRRVPGAAADVHGRTAGVAYFWTRGARRLSLLPYQSFTMSTEAAGV